MAQCQNCSQASGIWNYIEYIPRASRVDKSCSHSYSSFWYWGDYWSSMAKINWIPCSLLSLSFSLKLSTASSCYLIGAKKKVLSLSSASSLDGGWHNETKRSERYNKFLSAHLLFSRPSLLWRIKWNTGWFLFNLLSSIFSAEELNLGALISLSSKAEHEVIRQTSPKKFNDKNRSLINRLVVKGFLWTWYGLGGKKLTYYKKVKNILLVRWALQLKKKR